MSVKTLQPTTDTESRWELSLEATAKLKDCFVRTPEWHLADDMTFDQAGELLDFLDNQRIESREVHLQANGLLTVRWFS
jgi:hypothetical protein